mmetsp:Transcript_1236/g.2500  ORF Transcript_1236/g.2500 Transcript_1236/m.2500 type:complete len:407 (+) Transcript_1236:510-1730(+)
MTRLHPRTNDTCNSNLEIDAKTHSIKTFAGNNNHLKKNAKHEGLFQHSSCNKVKNSEENNSDMYEVINSLEYPKQNFQKYSSLLFESNFMRRKGRGHGAQFPEKLYTVLEAISRANLLDIVAWADHGQVFYIHRLKHFEQVILPLFFKNIKWTSFQRQLNLYRFKLVRQETDLRCYYHELFLRGRPELCTSIERTEVKKRTIKISLNSEQSSVDSKLSLQQTEFEKVHKGMNNDNRELSTNTVEAERIKSVQKAQQGPHFENQDDFLSDCKSLRDEPMENSGLDSYLKICNNTPLKRGAPYTCFQKCSSNTSTIRQADHTSLNSNGQLVDSKFKEQIVEKDTNDTVSSVKHENNALLVDSNSKCSDISLDGSLELTVLDEEDMHNIENYDTKLPLISQYDIDRIFK